MNKFEKLRKNAIAYQLISMAQHSKLAGDHRNLNVWGWNAPLHAMPFTFYQRFFLRGSLILFLRFLVVVNSSM
jgi:hypothetical protein